MAESDQNQPHRAAEPAILLASVLAWLGAIICFMLLPRHAGIQALFCPSRAGCEAVLSSRYSALLGVPLPWIGAAFYLSLLAMLLIAHATGSKPLRVRLLGLALWLTIAGVSFSAILMGVQFAVLQAFCALCTASALVMVALAFSTNRAERVATTADCAGSRSASLALASFALIAATVLAVSGVVSDDDRVRTLQIDLSTAKVAGPRDARVQLVVFSDFQCHYCAQLAPVLKRIREEFPREVMVAYRYFPLETHDRAYPAAIAAECAAEQGKFWEYHDKLFAEGGDLSDAKLLALAGALSLDQERFKQCLSSDRPRKLVEASSKDAAGSGLEGAPALFLNGTMIGGVVDYRTLAAKITRLLQASPAATPGVVIAPR